MSGVHYVTVADDEGDVRVDRWFKRHYPHIKHGQLEKMLRKGEIRVDKSRVKGNTRLEPGQEIRIPPLPPAPKPGEVHISKADARMMRDMVIYEDDLLIALNKPSGLAVQGGTKTPRHIDGLLPVFEKNGESPRLVHRLDRDTSGVLVVAKTASAAAMLGKAFKSRQAVKTYWAVTNGTPNPAAGEIKGHMAKRGAPGQEQMEAVRHGEPGAKHARTIYGTITHAGQKAAWLAMRPLTGRTHQLRLHCQLLGTPIMGDPRYLTDRPMPVGLEDQLHLHARELRLPRPQGGEWVFQAPLPDHMQHTFEALGFDEAAEWDVFEEEL